MRHFSQKRQHVEVLKKDAYAKIVEDRGPYCEVCGANTFDFSHNLARSRFPMFIADEGNITLLCRRHHNMWENNELWEMNHAVMARFISFISEIDDDRIMKDAVSHLISKLFICLGKANEIGLELPPFVKIVMDEFEINITDQEKKDFIAKTTGVWRPNPEQIETVKTFGGIQDRRGPDDGSGPREPQTRGGSDDYTSGPTSRP